MLVIKRYPNRKLYDTEAKQYITLDGVADLIRQGREVQVVDHLSGEDLTTVVLTQIIFEQEKKQGGFLPRAVLTGLIQAGGNTLGSLRRSLASPLDLLRQIDEEIERRIDLLIQRGELAEADARRLRDQLLAREPPAEQALVDAQTLEKLLQERGVPTRADLDQLAAQIEALSVSVDDLTSPPGET
jgi:polyhydroxyalkanoate synthesis repressor PhaR